MATPGGRIVREFDSGTALRGFVVEHAQSKKTALIYVDPDGQFLFTGMLFDGQGNNLSTAHYEAHVPKPDAAAIIKDAESTAWIEDGSPTAKTVLYVLGEPNCGYCKVFYQQTRPAVAKGDLALRWIMIGFDMPGKLQSASLYAAPNMGKALYEMYTKGPSGKAAAPYGIGSASGPVIVVGPRPVNEAPPQTVARNEAYAQKHGLGGTPHILYRTVSGAVQSNPGVPQPLAMVEIMKIGVR